VCMYMCVGVLGECVIFVNMIYSEVFAHLGSNLLVCMKIFYGFYVTRHQHNLVPPKSHVFTRLDGSKVDTDLLSRLSEIFIPRLYS